MKSPIERFQELFELAKSTEESPQDVMTLATATKNGVPSVRQVLFRGLYQGQFCFYSNYESRKANEIENSGHAALLFYWKRMQMQVRVEGKIIRAPQELSERYFAKRPRGSQIGAWASDQSQPLSDFGELEERTQNFENKFADQNVPRPSHWGGYLVAPKNIEFWKSGENRLHRRELFTRKEDSWQAGMLYP